MNRGSVYWIVLLVAATALGLGVACGGSDSCVPNNCASGAWMRVPLSSTGGGLAGMSVSACRNDECYSGTLPALLPADSTGAAVFFSTTTAVTGTLWQQTDGAVVLDVEWYLADASQAVDGDHYVVKLANAIRVSTTLLDKLAVYHPTEPVTNECQPAAICSIAELAP